jgi:adenine/guanine phosphoribosyltransferase-like PRPP-binding protein
MDVKDKTDPFSRFLEGWVPPSQAHATVLDFSDTYMGRVHDPSGLLAAFVGTVPQDMTIDTLVGRGVSGTIAVVNLARDLGMNYLIVRKDTEGSHAEYEVEGKLGKNWLFVDDVVSTGRTFRTSYHQVGKLQANGFESEFRGIFLYNSVYPVYYSQEESLEWINEPEGAAW